MGDLFFVIKMSIYTLVLIIILQVKVGPTTLEQKLYNVTHQSELAGVIQGVAQGAAHFIGVQYNHLAGRVKNTKFLKQHSSTHRPGDRLKNKFEELKTSINQKWEEKKDQIPEKEENKEN